MKRHPSRMVLATDGAETWPHSRRRGISLSANTVSADTTNVAALKNSARSTWLVRKIGGMELRPRLMSASKPNTSPAIGAVPKVVTRLNWLACSSRSAGTRFGTVASLAGVQNSEALDERNCTVYAQVQRDGQVQRRPHHVADDHGHPPVEPVGHGPGQRAEDQCGQQ